MIFEVQTDDGVYICDRDKAIELLDVTKQVFQKALNDNFGMPYLKFRLREAMWRQA